MSRTEPVTPEAVVEALRPVEDPELHRSIVDLGMVRDVVVDGDRVALTVVLTVPGCPLKGEISSRVGSALAAIGVSDVDLSWGAMTDAERAGVREKLHGDPASTAGSQQAHGHEFAGVEHEGAQRQRDHGQPLLARGGVIALARLRVDRRGRRSSHREQR